MPIITISNYRVNDKMLISVLTRSSVPLRIHYHNECVRWTFNKSKTEIEKYKINQIKYVCFAKAHIKILLLANSMSVVENIIVCFVSWVLCSVEQASFLRVFSSGTITP
jgi:hypothetical protein